MFTENNIRIKFLDMNNKIKLIPKNQQAPRPLKSRQQIREEQQQLWDAGAFEGVLRNGRPLTQAQAVDGLDGELTQQARKNYKKMQTQTTTPSYRTFSFDTNNQFVGGLVSNMSQAFNASAQADVATQKNTSIRVPLRPKIISQQKQNVIDLQQSLLSLGYDLGKSGVDGIWGSDSEKALQKALSEGYELKNNRLSKKQLVSRNNQAAPSEVVATPGSQDLIDRIKTGLSNGLYDNLYPYSYGDIYDENTGKYRQITGSESSTEQAKAGYDKVVKGLKGMDPRREMMNRMAAVDLSTDEGWAEYQQLIKEANSMDHQMVRYNARNRQQAINQQWEMRARLDAMNLYQGRPQQWNTYIEQQDESKRSKRATDAGKPTLIIRDANQRNRINGEMLNYWNSHPEQRVQEGGLWKLPFMSYLGNAKIIQQPDGSLRYADDWDYTWSTEGDPNRPYFGEVLTDFSGKGYGMGVNGRAFSEGMDHLAAGIYDEQVAPKLEEVKSTIENMFSKGTNYLGSLF